MEVIHSRCAGMDISKKDAKVCVRLAGSGRRKRSRRHSSCDTLARYGHTRVLDST